MEKVAFLFAGQGAQYVGMGKDLYDNFAQSRLIFDQADKVLGFSLSQLCFGGPPEELTKTQNCQPAILTMSIAAWEAFKTESGKQEVGSGYAAGLSLGEYSALVAAQALSFEDAVYLVRRRGEYMEEAARSYPGKMVSLIGLDLDSVRKICCATHTEIANINCPGQIVISGKVKDIEEAVKLAQERRETKRVIELEVSGAFHCTLMSEVSLKLAKELKNLKINTPRIAVVSNVSAKPVTSIAEIRDNLVKQVAATVLWEDSMRFMLAQGILKFFEFGPGKVLKGLMRRINENAEVINIEKKEDILGTSEKVSKTADFRKSNADSRRLLSGR